MRHGWEWWEGFHKWIITKQEEKLALAGDEWPDLLYKYMLRELKEGYKEFEEKWRTEKKIEIPHPNQSSP